MNRFTLPVLVLSVGLLSCAPPPAIHVGAKNFPEQKILAEMIHTQLLAAGLPAAGVVDCVDTYGCQRMLRGGQIDVMVEYTGTGLAYAGAPVKGDKPAFDRVQELYAPQGIDWVAPLGFDNSYQVITAANAPTLTGVNTLEDLAARGKPVRVACPSEYLARPGDGLAALVRRYGLQVAGKPIVVDDAAQRYRLLLAGGADIVIGYGTDGAIGALDLKVLSDPLDFFPDYRAAVVMRSEADKLHPGLKDALLPFRDAISAPAMRSANYAVDVEGKAPHATAVQLLDKTGLAIAGDAAAPAKAGARMSVAVAPSEDLDGLANRTVLAVRQAFPGRAVGVDQRPRPDLAVANGGARLALVGAERFFTVKRGKVRRNVRMQAAAVVGSRVMHLVRRTGAESAGLDGKIGIQTGQRGPGLVGELWLGQTGAKPAARGDVATLLSQVESGDLDGALILARVGAPRLTTALQAGKVRLANLPPVTAPPLPCLRPARIPQGATPTRPPFSRPSRHRLCSPVPPSGDSAKAAVVDPRPPSPQRRNP